MRRNAAAAAWLKKQGVGGENFPVQQVGGAHLKQHRFISLCTPACFFAALPLLPHCARGSDYWLAHLVGPSVVDKPSWPTHPPRPPRRHPVKTPP